MELLAPDEFRAVLPLLPTAHNAGHMTMVHAVIEGVMPGKVLVDSLERPRSAIVLNDCGFHAALGEPPSEPLRPLITMIATDLVSAEPGLLIDITGSWSSILSGVFPPSYFRNEYHAPAIVPPSRPVPDGFSLVPITAEIAKKFDGAVDPWVVRIWGGPEAFVAKSFGYATLDANGDLAGFCTSCGIGGGEAEIEIGTNGQFRQRGLAHVAATRFMAESYRRGLVPAWTCQSDNEPSCRLAESLGYECFRKVECFPLNQGFVPA